MCDPWFVGPPWKSEKMSGFGCFVTVFISFDPPSAVPMSQNILHLAILRQMQVRGNSQHVVPISQSTTYAVSAKNSSGSGCGRKTVTTHPHPLIFHPHGVQLTRGYTHVHQDPADSPQKFWGERVILGGLDEEVGIHDRLLMGRRGTRVPGR